LQGDRWLASSIRAFPSQFLRSHFPFIQVILCRNAEGVSHAIEERKHRGDVDGFRDLIFGPACITQFLNIRVGGTWRSVGDEFDVGHQGTFRRCQARFIKFAFEDRCYALIVGSLNPQEVGVAVESIRATVQKRNIARDHFLVTADKVAFGKMNCVGKVDDLFEEIGASAEAFYNAGNFFAAGVSAPVIVGFGCFPFCVGILSNVDFRRLRVRVVMP
jgi:hypothetical protein